MRWALAALSLLALPGWAHAGACCVASTTTVPARLGECETWMAGIGLTGDVTVGRWDSGGALATSSLAEQSLMSTLAAGYRWDRKGQISLTAPVWLQHKAAGDTSAWGGGLGDLRLAVTWDPIEEKYAAPGKWGWPVPVFTLGARIPTGRSWEQAKGALGEDVTGLAGPALSAGVSFERFMARTPFALGLDADLGLDHGELQPVIRGSFGIGRTIGTRWTVLGTLRHVHAFSHGAESSRTLLGARVIHGQMLRWRAWAGAEADLPVPMLGVAAQRQVSIGAGVAIVR